MTLMMAINDFGVVRKATVMGGTPACLRFGFSCEGKAKASLLLATCKAADTATVTSGTLLFYL